MSRDVQCPSSALTVGRDGNSSNRAVVFGKGKSSLSAKQSQIMG